MPHIVTNIFDAFVFGFGAGLGWCFVQGVLSLFTRKPSP